MPELPSLEELLDSAHVVSLPMRVKFRGGIMERETLLLRGPHGWGGEFCPFPEYDDDESSRWLAAALEAGWLGFPTPVRDRIPVNATVPAVSAERVPEVLARFGRVDAVKIKVAERGQSLREDIARVNAVREALPNAAIRVDANGGWDIDQAVEAWASFPPLNSSMPNNLFPPLRAWPRSVVGSLPPVRQSLSPRTRASGRKTIPACRPGWGS